MSFALMKEGHDLKAFVIRMPRTVWTGAVGDNRRAGRSPRRLGTELFVIIIIIDVAIPADRNVVQKETEKKLKYNSLCIEIKRMWNLKCTIVPVIIGDTGIVTRSLKKNLETVPGKHSIDSLQNSNNNNDIYPQTEMLCKRKRKRS